MAQFKEVDRADPNFFSISNNKSALSPSDKSSVPVVRRSSASSSSGLIGDTNSNALDECSSSLDVRGVNSMLSMSTNLLLCFFLTAC